MPGCGIEVKAVHNPVDQSNRIAEVGEVIEYEIISTNNGNVDVTNVTMADSVGGCQAATFITLTLMRPSSPKRHSLVSFGR